MSPDPHLPVVDVADLLTGDVAPSTAARQAAATIDRACRDVGFFAVTGHGLDPGLQTRLDATARDFFGLPDTEKQAIAMPRAGAAWRGWFPVGGELTSGVPDRKEGIYFGDEHAPDHPRVRSMTPLHGANQFPERPSELRSVVLDWLAAMRPLADSVMRGIAIGLGLDPRWFEQHLTGDPTVLFRVFHYPPDAGAPAGVWGVGEHTDYGLLTLLAQDRHGGLQVRRVDGRWIDVPASPELIVCNIGDMLERLTGGRYRSTPHRVRNTSGLARLSFPYFFDPSWEATVPTLPIEPIADRVERWDGADVLAWDGTYGDYLTAKVARVFPDLFRAATPDTATPDTATPDSSQTQ